MRVGIATDNGRLGLKEELVTRLSAAGHEVIDFGAHHPSLGDDHLDFVAPLARAVAAETVDRGMPFYGSGGRGVGLRQQGPQRSRRAHPRPLLGHPGVEDDDQNVFCVGGKAVGPEVAWDLIQAYLVARFSLAERHRRRLA